MDEENINVDIIVSRYNENLKWTLEYPFNKFKYIVYNKGDNNLFEMSAVKRVINLKNVGKCDHTYLYHICSNYYNLNKINVFLPGSVNMIHKKKIAIRILNSIIKSNYTKSFFVSMYTDNLLLKFKDFKMDSYINKYYANRVKNPNSSVAKAKIRPFGKWFMHFFNANNIYNLYCY